MGFWSWLSRPFRALGSSRDPGGSTVLHSFSTIGPMLRRGTPELFSAYSTSPFYRMVAHRLAHERATALRKHRVLFDGPDDDPRREQINRDDPRYEVMRVLRAPVTLTSGQIMTPLMRNRALALWFGLAGEAYSMKLRSRIDPTRTIGLVPLSPQWVIATPTEREPFYLVQVDNTCVPKRIDPSEVIPYVDLDPENIYGRGVGAGLSLAREIDTDDGAGKFARALLHNHGTPQGMLMLKGATPDQAKQARQLYRERFGGPDRAGQVEIAAGEAQWIPFDGGETFKESIELRRFLRDSFCHVEGISPEVMGILDGSTRDSSWVANQNLARGSIVPWLELATDAEQAHLVPEFVANPEDACLGYSSPIPDDKDLQVRVMATAPAAFKGRDARKVGGFAPDPDLDDKPLGAEPQKATPTQLPKAPGAMLERAEQSWALACAATDPGTSSP